MKREIISDSQKIGFVNQFLQHRNGSSQSLRTQKLPSITNFHRVHSQPRIFNIKPKLAKISEVVPLIKIQNERKCQSQVVQNRIRLQNKSQQTSRNIAQIEKKMFQTGSLQKIDFPVAEEITGFRTSLQKTFILKAYTAKKNQKILQKQFSIKSLDEQKMALEDLPIDPSRKLLISNLISKQSRLQPLNNAKIPLKKHKNNNKDLPWKLNIINLCTAAQDRHDKLQQFRRNPNKDPTQKTTIMMQSKVVGYEQYPFENIQESTSIIDQKIIEEELKQNSNRSCSFMKSIGYSSLPYEGHPSIPESSRIASIPQNMNIESMENETIKTNQLKW